MRRARIVVFAKRPLPGRVKTRLIPLLGADGAARLAAEMLAATLDEAIATGLDVELCGDPDPAGWCDQPGVRLAAQGDGSLGDRLARAAARVLGEGGPVLLIGADCPALDLHRLRAAAEALRISDAVIHPARDGGYALLGLTRFDPSLFADIAWSGPTVASATMARIETLGWTLFVGDTMRDVDEPGDVALVAGR